MKKSLLTLLFAFIALSLAAQQQQKFDAEQFQVKLEQFITAEASLSQAESTAFFPLYRELRKKQRNIFEQIKRYKHANPTDEKGAAEAIRQQDKLELEMKELIKDYHNKFIALLPATTVLRILKAEDKFHRQLFKGKKWKCHAPKLFKAGKTSIKLAMLAVGSMASFCFYDDPRHKHALSKKEKHNKNNSQETSKQENYCNKT